jgi:hypothetical protein
MECIADDLQGFIDWHGGEEADVRTNKNIWRLGVNGLNNFMQWAGFLTKDSGLPARDLRILRRKPTEA